MRTVREKTELPRDGEHVPIRDFLPPVDRSTEPSDDADFPAALKAIESRRTPPDPIRVVRVADGYQLADQRSWVLWTACCLIGSGIGVLPTRFVQVIERPEESCSFSASGDPLSRPRSETSSGLEPIAENEMQGDDAAAHVQTEPSISSTVTTDAATSDAERPAGKDNSEGSRSAMAGVASEAAEARKPARVLMEKRLVPIDDIRIVDDLFPRVTTKPNAGNVKRLGESLECLDSPVVISDENGLVDGRHRLEALRRAGRTEVEAEIYWYASEDELLKHAVEANVRHGLPLSSKDRKNVALRLFDRAVPLDDIAELLTVDVTTVRRWTQPRRKQAQEALDEKILELHATNTTQEKIAEQLGITRANVRSAIGRSEQMREATTADVRGDEERPSKTKSKKKGGRTSKAAKSGDTTSTPKATSEAGALTGATARENLITVRAVLRGLAQRAGELAEFDSLRSEIREVVGAATDLSGAWTALKGSRQQPTGSQLNRSLRSIVQDAMRLKCLTHDQAAAFKRAAPLLRYRLALLLDRALSAHETNNPAEATMFTRTFATVLEQTQVEQSYEV